MKISFHGAGQGVTGSCYWEEKSMKTFANKLTDTQVKMPKLGEEYAL